jgi:putative transposase
MHRNELGDLVALCWQWLAQHCQHVTLDEWVVMPNHLHGILVITSDSASPPGAGGKTGGGSWTAPTGRKPLGRLIGASKTISTNRANERRETPIRPLWQRDFHDHVIRDGDELAKIREHIRTNPLRWNTDPENV